MPLTVLDNPNLVFLTPLPSLQTTFQGGRLPLNASVTDATTGAPLSSLDISLAGTNPGNLIRYGAKGIAFRTIGTASPGYVYLVESPAVIP